MDDPLIYIYNDIQEVNFMAKKRGEPTISGRNIYKDKHNRYVLYNKKSQIGYVIPQDKFNQYQAYSNRYMMGVVAAILIVTFELSIFIGIGVGVALTGILEMRYRTSFLPNLTQLSNFNIGESRSKIQIAAEQTTGRLSLLAILYVVFGGLLVTQAYVGKMEEYMIYICWGIAAITVYMSINNIRVILYKSKHPNEVIEQPKKIKLKK